MATVNKNPLFSSPQALGAVPSTCGRFPPSPTNTHTLATLLCAPQFLAVVPRPPGIGGGGRGAGEGTFCRWQMCKRHLNCFMTTIEGFSCTRWPRWFGSTRGVDLQMHLIVKCISLFTYTHKRAHGCDCWHCQKEQNCPTPRCYLSASTKYTLQAVPVF